MSYKISPADSTKTQSLQRIFPPHPQHAPLSLPVSGVGGTVQLVWEASGRSLLVLDAIVRPLGFTPVSSPSSPPGEWVGCGPCL